MGDTMVVQKKDYGENPVLRRLAAGDTISQMKATKELTKNQRR